MLAGELYWSAEADLVERRMRARDLLARFNESGPRETQTRKDILGSLLGAAGSGLWIEPPFFCDYGENIRVGDNVFLNFNCVFLDCAPITIGSNVLFAPGVQLYAAYHPMDHVIRAKALEYAAPITIGDDVWFGGGVIVCPGVKIGARSVIGAGSVVTRDVPEGVVVAGNPCRVIRRVDEPSKRKDLRP
jgi:maltose O-acetyltransferase